MNFRAMTHATLRITIMHLFASVLFWTWMGVIALGYGFVDRDRRSLWVRFQAYAVPKIALTLTFPERLLFEQTGGEPWLLLLIALSNSVTWAALIVAALAWLKRRRTVIPTRRTRDI